MTITAYRNQFRSGTTSGKSVSTVNPYANWKNVDVGLRQEKSTTKVSFVSNSVGVRRSQVVFLESVG